MLEGFWEIYFYTACILLIFMTAGIRFQRKEATWGLVGAKLIVAALWPLIIFFMLFFPRQLDNRMRKRPPNERLP